ncbi:MAG: hypothetical protein AB7O67_03465 [Vicinamibacterales bacterium]
MRSSRFVSLAAALLAAVVALLPVRHESPRLNLHEPDGLGADAAGFDEPRAAAAYEQARRRPADPSLDTRRLYRDANARAARLRVYASRAARVLPAGTPAPRIWLDGSGHARATATRPGTDTLDAWEPLGPGNIGGRTRALLFHPHRHDTVYAAGVSGGVWRTDDAGASWRPIGDGLSNIAVNALVIDPRAPDTLLAGTGEGFLREEVRGTGLPLRGGGIFVTRDAGETWTALEATLTPDFYWVNDLVLGARDSRHVFAATRSGVWRSLDGGTTWSSLLSTDVRGGCLDLAIRPDRDGDELFASCGSWEQATVYRFAAAATSGEAQAVLREPGMGRTSLAIAPSAPDVIYALAASNTAGPTGTREQALQAVYRSDRGGVPGSWEPRVTGADRDPLPTLLLTNPISATLRECSGDPRTGNSITNMGWYTNVIAVDPADPDRVWAAGVDWFRSDDGGRTWGLASFWWDAEAASFAHADQHAIAFHPSYDGEANQIVIVGGDGGPYRTDTARARVATGSRATCDPAASAVRWQPLSHGYGVTQFYHGLPFPDGERYLAGAQDNGSIFGSDLRGADDWVTVLGGDGGYVAVDPTEPNTFYAESQWANIRRTRDGGFNWTDATAGLDRPTGDALGPDANYLFVTPLVMDPSRATRLWTGGDFLYRTDTSATRWSKASTRLPEAGRASALAVSPHDSNRVAAGTDQGDVLITDAGGTATASTEWIATRARDGWVTSVTWAPDAPDTLYATYGNFGGRHVYVSHDRGATWAPLDGDGEQALPDIPVHSLVVDPDDPARIYLGTDLGVFVSTTGGGTWMTEATGFGPAVTEWLALIRDTSGRKRLFAFTHGRGAWRVTLR